jgi:hypothetical protein
MYTERHGVEAAIEVVEFELAHVPAIKEVVERENIDCDLNITRSMNVCLDAGRAARVKAVYDEVRSRHLSFVDDIHWSTEKDAE